ncbi:MAG: hypothetical protein Q8R92_02010 [Deltaproteobacteria bacterium]|nr:hypothetical protein [Deltaproteobacteria bacterium]
MPEGSGSKLHFVYNVDATPLALVKDFVHRLVAPKTYPCKLCDVTYGRFIKKAEWRAFLRTLPIPSEFHLRSVFRRRFPSVRNLPLPAVFLERPAGTLRELIPARELAGVQDLETLESLVNRKIASLGLPATGRSPKRRARSNG